MKAALTLALALTCTTAAAEEYKHKHDWYSAVERRHTIAWLSDNDVKPDWLAKAEYYADTMICKNTSAFIDLDERAYLLSYCLRASDYERTMRQEAAKPKAKQPVGGCSYDCS